MENKEFAVLPREPEPCVVRFLDTLAAEKESTRYTLFNSIEEIKNAVKNVLKTIPKREF